VYKLKIYYGFEQLPPPPHVMKPLVKETVRLDVPVQVVQQMLKPPKRTKMTPNKQLIPMMPSSLIVHEVDFIVKETNPDFGKVVDYNHHYDHVEHMTYLFVHVVKTCGLATKDLNGSSNLVRFFCHPTFVHHLPCCSLVASLYAYGINLPQVEFKI
jgi:hypothetical protein